MYLLTTNHHHHLYLNKFIYSRNGLIDNLPEEFFLKRMEVFMYKKWQPIENAVNRLLLLKSECNGFGTLQNRCLFDNRVTKRYLST